MKKKRKNWFLLLKYFNMFSLKFSNNSAKFIKKLDNKDKERIKIKINNLCSNPFSHDCVRVEKYKDHKVFRVRVGKFRILYQIYNEENLIVIINVDNKGRVYK